MPLTGDFGKLRRLREGFAAMRNRATILELNEALGKKSQELVRGCFDRARTPHGIPWRPLKSRDGRPLRLSGRLYRSIQWSAGTRGYRVTTALPYSRVQNDGATIRPKTAAALAFRVRGKLVFAQKVVIPSRQYMPRGRLPVSWKRELFTVANRLVRRTMGVRP